MTPAPSTGGRTPAAASEHKPPSSRVPSVRQTLGASQSAVELGNQTMPPKTAAAAIMGTDPAVSSGRGMNRTNVRQPMSVRSTYQRNFRTTQQDLMLHVLNPEMLATAQEQRCGGLTRVENAFHATAHAMPKFERQKIRAIYNDNLVSGKIPIPDELLRGIPDMERPAVISARSDHPESARSAASTRTAGTSRSAYSQRSVRSSSSLGSKWVKQYRGDPDFHAKRYLTHNTFYGLGCQLNPWAKMPTTPSRGRELWMPRTKQWGEVDNCLRTDHLFQPRCDDRQLKSMPTFGA